MQEHDHADQGDHDRGHRDHDHDRDRDEELIIVYGTNKRLEVKKTETIEQVKIGGMELFAIPASEQGNFVLKAKMHGHEEQLDEAKTVQQYDLHDNQKVTLAAGTPFGTR